MNKRQLEKLKKNPDLFIQSDGEVFGHNIPIGGGMTASGWIGNIKRKQGHYKVLEIL